MSFSPARVIALIAIEFGFPDASHATHSEKRLYERMRAILREAQYGEFDVKEKEDMTIDENEKFDRDYTDED